MIIIRGLGELIHVENLKSKISWRCPFNDLCSKSLTCTFFVFKTQLQKQLGDYKAQGDEVLQFEEFVVSLISYYHEAIILDGGKTFTSTLNICESKPPPPFNPILFTVDPLIFLKEDVPVILLLGVSFMSINLTNMAYFETGFEDCSLFFQTSKPEFALPCALLVS